MPPKKSGSAGTKSASAAAAEAAARAEEEARAQALAAQQEAERLERMQQAAELLRNIEGALRDAEAGEVRLRFFEHALIHCERDELCARIQLERNEIELDERRLRERRRDVRLVQLFEAKDYELHTLKSSLQSLEAQLERLKGQHDEVSQRAAWMSSQYDALHVRYTELEQLYKGKTDVWKETENSYECRIKQLEAENKEMATQCHAYLEENQTLRQELNSSTQHLQTDISSLQHEKEKDETEHTILMKLLHTELEKTKQQAQHMQADLERRERDDVKNTIMLGLLNTQLDSAKEESKAQQQTVQELRRHEAALQDALDEARTKLAATVEETTHELDIHRRTAEHMTQELEVHRARVINLDAQVLQLTNDRDEANKALLEARNTHDESERAHFEQVVVLNAQLDRTQRDLEHAQTSSNESRDRFHTERATFQAELESLRQRHERLQELCHDTERRRFEAVTRGQSQLDAVTRQLSDAQEALSALEQSSTEARVQMQQEQQAERARWLTERAQFERREADAQMQCMKLQSHIEVLTQQVKDMQKISEDRDLVYVEKCITLNAEKENARNRLALVEERLERATKEWMDEATRLRNDLVAKDAAHEASLQRQEAVIAEHRCAEETLAGELVSVRSECTRLEEEKAKLERDAATRYHAYIAEMSSLRADVEEYKRTIEKLEGSVAENYNYKIIADQNEALRSDIGSYKNQIGVLRNTIATMKVEADILDTYKARVLKEQNEMYADRIEELEQDARQWIPLMNDAVLALQQYVTKFSHSGPLSSEPSASPQEPDVRFMNDLSVTDPKLASTLERFHEFRRSRRSLLHKVVSTSSGQNMYRNGARGGSARTVRAIPPS